MAMIGPRDSVLPFKVLGLDVFYLEDPLQAAQEINRMARSDFAIIFVTERLLREMPETVERYKNETLPAIIPVPDNHGSIGYGMDILRGNVEKAVGSNILMGKEGDERDAG